MTAAICHLSGGSSSLRRSDTAVSFEKALPHCECNSWGGLRGPNPNLDTHIYDVPKVLHFDKRGKMGPPFRHFVQNGWAGYAGGIPFLEECVVVVVVFVVVVVVVVLLVLLVVLLLL